MNGKVIAGLLIGSMLVIAVAVKNPVTTAVENFLLDSEQEVFITDLNPLVQNLFRQFITEVQNSGWHVLITSGYRTFAQQAADYAANSSNAQPGYSYHNYGLAIDINASNGSQWLRKATAKQDWIDSGIPAIAESFGLTWGGNFSNYADNVHFAYEIVSTNDLHQLAVNTFGNNPDDIQGNQLTLT